MTTYISTMLMVLIKVYYYVAMYIHISCKTEDALGSKGLSHCIVDEEAI